LNLEVSSNTFSNFSYTNSVMASSLRRANMVRNFLRMFLDEDSVKSVSFLAFSALLETEFNDFMSATLVVIVKFAMSLSNFLARNRNSFDVVSLLAYSPCMFCTFLVNTNTKSDMFACISYDSFTNVTNSICIAFLETFLGMYYSAIFIVSTFEVDFSGTVAGFCDSLLCNFFDGSLSGCSASSQCFSSAMLIFLANSFRDFFARYMFTWAVNFMFEFRLSCNHKREK
jgi:hypothetical protein